MSSPLILADPAFQPRCFALVPCAGIGERAGAGGPKQYHPVAGRPMVAHTLQALSSVGAIHATLVVLAPGDLHFEVQVPGFAGDHAWVARVGGATRAESVARGLDELVARGAQPHDWVLVHDAARCLVQPAWVQRLIDECRDDEIGGLLAWPLADTLKVSVAGPGGERRVSGTVDRSAKWAAQTPQLFRLGLLRGALNLALSDPASANAVTDEASAVEALGHQPRLVHGDPLNFKVTWPGDFALAERLLRA